MKKLKTNVLYIILFITILLYLLYVINNTKTLGHYIIIIIGYEFIKKVNKTINEK